MNAVGIDVSNGKSMVFILKAAERKKSKPFEVKHTAEGLVQLLERLNELDGETRIVMEHTGRYYESIAMFLNDSGFFVSAVNPMLITQYGANSIRKVKTDKTDSQKIAKYALANWGELRQYTPMDTVRYELKTLNRQFQLSVKSRTACSNNLIALLEQTYPGIRAKFSSPVREDGSQKWVDFVAEFWHVACVRELSLEAFTAQYKEWCGQHQYRFSKPKAMELHTSAQQLIALVPKSSTSEILVREAVRQLNAISHTVEVLRAEMNRMASMLPEYETVMSMTGVGPSMGPQLMAEIGDIRRFASQRSLVAYAGTDPGANQSGTKNVRSNRTSKRGSPHLRRTLFIIMLALLQGKPDESPVYQFLDKKRSEGKPYYVYMTAGGTKFLRIYYGKVRDCLKEKGLWSRSEIQEVGTL